MRHIEAIDNFNTTLQNIPLWVYIIPYIMHFLTVVYLFSKKEVIRGSKPLYDTIISNIPDLSKFRNIPNMLLLVLMSYLIIPLFFKPNIDVFISIYRYFSIILLLRSFTISSTILPPINSNCDFKLCVTCCWVLVAPSWMKKLQRRLRRVRSQPFSIPVHATYAM